MLESTICQRLLIGLLAMSLGTTAAHAAPDTDHPLVTRYQGSTIADKTAVDFGEYKLVTGLTAKGEFEGEALKGKVTRIVYENPAGRSTLETFANYEQALSGAGLTTIYTCALDECGPAYARSAWSRYNGLFAAADGDPRYLGGKLTKNGNTAYVALMVGKIRTQLDIVEIQGMQGDMVVVDAAALGQAIDRDGKVSVYGIYFDTDKTEVKPESKSTLEEIAKLMRDRPKLALYVVGHTDMTGTLEHNRTLSEGRARSVVKALVGGHGIGAARLEGHGVGPLAPVATNASEAGRAKNRRVELVAR